MAERTGPAGRIKRPRPHRAQRHRTLEPRARARRRPPLGARSDRERVRASGLWNNNHVDEGYDPAFLDEMAALVDAERRSRP